MIKNRTFSLTSKKVLTNQETDIEIILVDVTESEIEHPKKTKRIIFKKKEKTHNRNTNNCK